MSVEKVTELETKLADHLREVLAYAREFAHDWLCMVEAEAALAAYEAKKAPLQVIQAEEDATPNNAI